MDTLELWRDVKEYEGIYQVSNLGNSKNLGGFLCEVEASNTYQKTLKGLL